MNLFAPQEGSDQKLMEVMDHLNHLYGPGTLRYGATGLKRKWQMRSEKRSPRYTTCWEELPQV
jgi:DNA polymerase V